VLLVSELKSAPQSVGESPSGIGWIGSLRHANCHGPADPGPRESASAKPM